MGGVEELKEVCHSASREQKLFWMQAHGEIAANLPQWYIKKDTRIVCQNEDCHVNMKCELYSRYIKACQVYGRRIVRISSLSYRLNPKQSGILPCKHYIEWKEKTQ